MGANSDNEPAITGNTLAGGDLLLLVEKENKGRATLKTPHSAPTLKHAPALSDRTNNTITLSAPQKQPATLSFAPSGRPIIEPRHQAILRELKCALKEALEENRRLTEEVRVLRGREWEWEECRAELVVVRALYEAAKEELEDVGVETVVGVVAGEKSETTTGEESSEKEEEATEPSTSTSSTSDHY
jgi:hypothetical protein